MDALLFAAGSLIALFWALLSIFANVFTKRDAPPRAILPPPRKISPAASLADTAEEPLLAVPLTAEPASFDEPASASTSVASLTSSVSVSDERELLTPPESAETEPDPAPIERSGTTFSSGPSTMNPSSSSSSYKPRRTFTEFKVAFSQSFAKASKRRSSNASISGSATDTELVAPDQPVRPQRERSRSSSRTRAPFMSIFTSGMSSKNRTTPSPASSDFPLTPSDAPLPLPVSTATATAAAEDLSTNSKQRGIINLPSTQRSRPPIRRVSAPATAPTPAPIAGPSSAPAVHFALPIASEPVPASSSLGLETQPTPPPSTTSAESQDTSSRGRKTFWTRSFSRRTSIDPAAAPTSETETEPTRRKVIRRSTSLVRSVKTRPIVETPATEDATPKRSAWLERRDSQQRGNSIERSQSLKDRHTRCAEVAHAAWGATTAPTKPKRPKFARASTSTSVASAVSGMAP